MEAFLVWLGMNWLNIGVLALFVVAMIYLWQKGYKNQVSMYILTLIARAEVRFEHGANKDKLESVITGIYEKFPNLIKFFYTRDDLVNLINEIVKDTKEWLQNQSK